MHFFKSFKVRLANYFHERHTVFGWESLLLFGNPGSKVACGAAGA